MEFDFKECDPVMFSNTQFKVGKNYFEFNVWFDPFGVKELKTLLIKREEDLIIRNESLERPRNIKVVFNARSNLCFLRIAHLNCVFMERPNIMIDFILKDCEFI